MSRSSRPMPSGMKEQVFPECFKALTWELMDKICLVEPSPSNPILPENLPDEIHPLYDFSYSRWRMPNAKKFHDGWYVGLKLASYLLDTDWVLTWFTKAAYGELCKGLNYDGMPTEYVGELPDDLPFEVALEKTRGLLREHLIPYLFFKYNTTSDEKEQAFGETHPEKNFAVNVPLEKQHELLIDCEGRGLSVGFHPQWESYALRRQVQFGDTNSNWHDGCYPGSQALDFRAQLMFAFTLLHETAHVVEIARFYLAQYDRRGHIESFGKPEVFYDLELERNEWGFQLEFYLCGMMLKTVVEVDDVTESPESFSPLPKYGLVGLKEDGYMHGCEKEYFEYELLLMEWVAFWFRKENLYLLETHGNSALPKPSDWYLAKFKIAKGYPWHISVMKRGDSNPWQKHEPAPLGCAKDFSVLEHVDLDDVQDIEMGRADRKASPDLDTELLLLAGWSPSPPPESKKRPHPDDEDDEDRNLPYKKPKPYALRYGTKYHRRPGRHP